MHYVTPNLSTAADLLADPPATLAPQFAIYTDSGYGAIQSDDSVSPLYVNVPVWAFIVHTTLAAGETLNAGGTNVGGKAHPTVLKPGTTCDSVWLVGATTGTSLGSFRDCAPPR